MRVAVYRNCEVTTSVAREEAESPPDLPVESCKALDVQCAGVRRVRPADAPDCKEIELHLRRFIPDCHRGLTEGICIHENRRLTDKVGVLRQPQESEPSNDRVKAGAVDDAVVGKCCVVTHPDTHLS